MTRRLDAIGRGVIPPETRINRLAAVRRRWAGLTRSTWEDLKAKLYLGSDAFIAQIEKLMESRQTQAVAPALQGNIRAVDAAAVLRMVEAGLEI